MSKHEHLSDNTLSWIAVALSLLVVVVLDKEGMPQKWHAAVMWTLCAFGPVTVMHRKRWRIWSFWTSWILYLGVHLLIVLALFVYVLGSVRILGTLYVVPFGLVESLFLLGLLSERRQPKRSTHQ